MFKNKKYTHRKYIFPMFKKIHSYKKKICQIGVRTKYIFFVFQYDIYILNTYSEMFYAPFRVHPYDT